MALRVVSGCKDTIRSCYINALSQTLDVMKLLKHGFIVGVSPIIKEYVPYLLAGLFGSSMVLLGCINDIHTNYADFIVITHFNTGVWLCLLYL